MFESYFQRKGNGVGESSALARCAALQLGSYGAVTKFVMILADGHEKKP